MANQFHNSNSRTQKRTPKHRPLSSHSSCYWSKTFTMVLNVKTMTSYFVKNSVKTCKQHHIVCRLRNPHFSLKSCARKYFSISPRIKSFFKDLQIRPYQFLIMYQTFSVASKTNCQSDELLLVINPFSNCNRI